MHHRIPQGAPRLHAGHQTAGGITVGVEWLGNGRLLLEHSPDAFYGTIPPASCRRLLLGLWDSGAKLERKSVSGHPSLSPMHSESGIGNMPAMSVSGVASVGAPVVLGVFGGSWRRLANKSGLILLKAGLRQAPAAGGCGARRHDGARGRAAGAGGRRRGGGL